MSEKPPPLPLDYQRPPAPSAGNNRWWKVLLRIAAGGILCIASTLAGGWLGNQLGIPLLGLFVPVGLLGLLIFVAIRFRRFGYVTGFVIAPFIIVGALIVLLITYCGSGSHW